MPAAGSEASGSELRALPAVVAPCVAPLFRVTGSEARVRMPMLVPSSAVGNQMRAFEELFAIF